MPSRRFVPLWCFCAAALPAQAAWSPVPGPVFPPARQNHAAAYDVARSRLVIFSGQPLTQDTWEFDGSTWHGVVTAAAPAARLGHWMAYDVGRGRTVLFGGSTDGSDVASLGDTWEWDGAVWQQRFPASSPSARLAHAMTADFANGRIVLFGGRDAASVHQNDTWAWNGTNWTLLAATGPTPRCCFDLAQDLLRNRIVLFGGWNGSDRGDTWEFDGASWQQIVPAGPSPGPRWGHRTAFDLVRGVLVLHGGFTFTDETWQWNGVTWTLAAVDAGAARFNHTLHHDWTTGRPTMFGGGGGLAPDTTWTYGVAAPATLQPFGSGCAGPAGAPQLGAVAPGLPWIGQSFTLRATGVSPFALFLFGWSNAQSGATPLPYSLAPHGAPGCSVLVSPDAVFGVVSSPLASLAVAVPYAPSIVGLPFHVQAASFDAGANPLGLTVSNATTATIGWQ